MAEENRTPIPGKEYLGDGVYVQLSGAMLELTAENGMCVTDRIYLEPEVLINFIEYAKRTKLIMGL